MRPHHIFAVAIAAVVVAPAARAGDPSNAEMLCYVMDNTRSVAPCAISETGHTVTINTKLEGQDAAEVCRQVQASLVKQRMFFDGDRWRLQITTPATGRAVVASCDLPQTPK